MCFDLDSRPPIPPIAGAAVDGSRIVLHAADGTDFSAFHAIPSEPNGAGMMILPDVRGLHPFFEELALRFAEAGVEAIAIDYFGRTAGLVDDDSRGDSFDYSPHADQIEWDAVLADMRAAGETLRSGGRVRGLFSVGFCVGGRISFLTATRPELDMSGAIGFYGWPSGPGRGGMPAPADIASEFKAPILGIFGGADRGITSEIVEGFRRALESAGVENEIVTYPGAPHSFFDRKQDEFQDASTDAWKRTLDFVSANTPPAEDAAAA
jgi:carboxymethylenebutenolidase